MPGNTKVKVGNLKRLLLVNSYLSYINLRFINYYNQNRIILAILPPYSIYRL